MSEGIRHYVSETGVVYKDPCAIQYIECDNKWKGLTYSDPSTGGFETLWTQQSLKSILKDNSFLLQTHRQYAVNVNYVTLVDKDYVTMSDGVQIPISRRYRKLVNEVLS